MSVLGTDFALMNSDAVARVSQQMMRAFERPQHIFTHPRIIQLLSKPQIIQRSPEWYECRNKVLTASDAGTVLGINPFSSRQTLLERKLFARLGLNDGRGGMDKFGIIACEHGEKYEDEAAREYFARHPENGMLFNFGLIQHPVHTFLAGSPDRVTQNGILIEIKVS
jgi:putative phage-type endonuclease